MTTYNYATMLVRAKICQQTDMQGCSEREIQALAQAAGHTLPAAYKAFLDTMGNGAGDFLASYDIFAKQLPGLRESAIRLLEQAPASYTLPEDAFVFAMHQGYEFNFFLCSEGDDPPVYQFVEGSDEPVPVWQSFSAFMLDQIEQQTNAAQ